MGISLYRKYRPQTFGGVYGQKAAIDIIASSIAKDRVGHAYLFSGSRGCGKTSVARIFAKALNCTGRQDNHGFEPCGHCPNCTSITQGENLDVIEIDGASNNGVDNIRDLKENVTLAPFSSKYKIYIVDEVHMLSQGAFNALLKTLEEPPEHVIFILATTEPHKVPVTIRSRCQHIPFHSISPNDIYKRLEEVCGNENFNFEPEALWEIARQADGALRDALSLLEQVTAAGDINIANVEASFGTGSRSAFEKWLVALRTSPGDSYEILKSMFEAGASGVRVFEEIFALVRDLWLVSKWNRILENLGGSEPEKKFLREESSKWKPEKLHYLLTVVNKSLIQARMGMRNDIILGTFFMLLEQPPVPAAPQPPVQYVQPVNAQPPSVPSPAPAPTVQAMPVANEKANIVEFDEALKEKLINIAHENGKNFLIYCGLFDARPMERGNNLILDMESPLAYDILRQDRNAAGIAGIFNNYSSVILKFGTSEAVCRAFNNDKTEETPQAQDFAPGTATLEAYAETQAQENGTKTGTQRGKFSAFDKIKNELARLQAKPEIILISRRENEEEESETESENNNLETDGDD